VALQYAFSAQKLIIFSHGTNLTGPHQNQSTESNTIMTIAPNDFLCPLSKKVMQEPVSTPTGMNYERAPIEEWLRERAYCPVHGTPLRAESLKLNISLQWKIRYWQRQNERMASAKNEEQVAPLNLTTSTPLQKFICPLTEEIMQDPVMSKTGYSFERAAILKWFMLRGNICPLSGKPLQMSNIVSHPTLRREIQWWLQSQESQCVMYVGTKDTSVPGLGDVVLPLETLPAVSRKAPKNGSRTTATTKSNEYSHTTIVQPKKSASDAKSTFSSRGVGASTVLRDVMKNAYFLPANKENDFQRGGKEGILSILDDVECVLG
jgi:hypothetical protein